MSKDIGKDILINKEVLINENIKINAEDILSCKQVLDRLFSRLIEENKEAGRRERKMREALISLAIKQYPEYDTKIHTLSYNWLEHKLFIDKRSRIYPDIE